MQRLFPQRSTAVFVDQSSHCAMFSPHAATLGSFQGMFTIRLVAAVPAVLCIKVIWRVCIPTRQGISCYKPMKPPPLVPFLSPAQRGEKCRTVGKRGTWTTHRTISIRETQLWAWGLAVPTRTNTTPSGGLLDCFIFFLLQSLGRLIPISVIDLVPAPRGLAASVCWSSFLVGLCCCCSIVWLGRRSEVENAYHVGS